MWFKSTKFWSSATVVVVIAGTFAAVFAGKVDELMEVSPFLGSILSGGFFGYAIGKGSTFKK